MEIKYADASIKKIKTLSHLNVNGVIVGKAIYEGVISIYELSRC